MRPRDGDNPQLFAAPTLPVPTEPRPRLRKAAALRGQHLVLRNAGMDDAAFIWQLRRNAARNAFMSPTSAELADQQAWLARYAQDDTQAYFVITQAGTGEPLGTVRLYDAQGESFCWGSWMLVPGAPATAAMESALIVYHHALGLGFRAAHFEVHEANAPVRRFHERFGAVRVGQRGDQVQYALAAANLQAAMAKYSRWLPQGVQVETLDGGPAAPSAQRGAAGPGAERTEN